MAENNTTEDLAASIDNHSLIFVQWTNNVGGLERISKSFERTFQSYNPLVAILRHNDKGLIYKNSIKFNKKNKLFFVLEYLNFVRKRRDSIFHIQSAGDILFLTYLAGARKIIFHFHGTKFSNKFHNRIIWKLLQNKVIVIANSSFTKKIIKNKLNLSREIVTIPNLIDLEKISYEERSTNEEIFNVTYAGRFTTGKNINVIIDVAKILSERRVNINFTLVGEGPEKDNVQKLVDEYNLYNTVSVLPFTHDLLKIYHKSNLFLFLSSYESFGNVVAEAILSGLPILCYRLPSLSEFIKEEYFFLDNLEPKNIAERILEIKNNYSDTVNKLAQVYSFTREYLNNQKIIDRLNRIYCDLNN